MPFGIDDALGLIGLLAALASTGITTGKGAAESSEQGKIKSREEDINRDLEKRRREEEQEQRRAAISRAIGSGTNLYKPKTDITEPYQPRDLSGFDIAAGITNTAGSLASTAAQGMGDSNISEGVSAAGNEVDGYFPGGGVDSTGVTGDPLAKRPMVDDLTAVPGETQPYSRYGGYAKRRYS